MLLTWWPAFFLYSVVVVETKVHQTKFFCQYHFYYNCDEM